MQLCRSLKSNDQLVHTCSSRRKKREIACEYVRKGKREKRNTKEVEKKKNEEKGRREREEKRMKRKISKKERRGGVNAELAYTLLTCSP